MMGRGWSWSVVSSALAVGLCLIGAPTSGSAQTVPSPTDTPTPTATNTPAPVAVTDTPTVVPGPTVTPTTFSSGVPCATDDPSTERVQRSEHHGDDEDGVGDQDEFRSGNGHNEVIVHNCTDERLRVRAAIQLNTIPGQVVTPLNEAFAESSCVHCQTLAVALQIDLYSAERANDVEPGNFAVAINSNCTGCVTVARAIQYVQGVDEPRDVSEDISTTVNDLANELAAIQSNPSITLPEAESRLNAVIVRFNALGGSLGDQREERDD
jgi:hypothetical protein